MSRPVPWAGWPEWALLLCYWGARLHRLTAYPVFDDESIHIRQAKMVWKLLPFSGADDGRVLNILLYAPFWPFGPGAVWVSRAAYLLVGAIGFAALLALGRRLFGPAASRWAGALFILLPFAFFFERIALADTLGLPLVTLLALASLRAVALGGRRAEGQGGNRPHKYDWWAVAVGGLALAGAILAKVNNLVFLFVPVWALLVFRPPAGQRASLRRVAGIYLVAAATLAPFVLFLVFRAHSTLGLANILARTEARPLGERLAEQGATLAGYVGPYLTRPIAILALAALALRLRDRGVWFVFALAALPLAAFAFGANSLESRYLAPVAPAFALLAGATLPRLVAGQPQSRRGIVAILLAGLVALGGPLQFMWAGWYAPERLALPASDRPDYLEDWPSGFGVEAAGRLILERAGREPLTVIVTEGWHMAGLTVHYGWEENLHGVYDFSEARLRLAWLTSGCDPFALAGDAPGATLYVADRYRYAATTDCLRAEKELIASFPKPGETNVIDVYEIRPLPQ